MKLVIMDTCFQIIFDHFQIVFIKTFFLYIAQLYFNRNKILKAVFLLFFIINHKPLIIDTISLYSIITINSS